MSTDYPIGKTHRLRQCATPNGHFVILALDHRGNLRRPLNPAAPESVSYGAMVEFKQQVVDKLAAVSSAVLLDPEYGAAQSVAVGALPRQVGLVVAVEKTGYTGDPSARESLILPGWGQRKVGIVITNWNSHAQQWPKNRTVPRP